MKAIASMHIGHCLDAFEMLQWKFTISSQGALYQSKNALVLLPFPKRTIQARVTNVCQVLYHPTPSPSVSTKFTLTAQKHDFLIKDTQIAIATILSTL